MKFGFVSVIFLAFCVGCQSKGNPELDKYLNDKKIIRFDRDVATLNKQSPDLKKLQKKYGRYFEVYTEGVLQLGKVTDPDFPRLFTFFLNDSTMREVMDSVEATYRDMSFQEKELTAAFQRYALLFPDRSLPEIYAHVSGFNQSIIVDSTFVSISLDAYLGENCIFYKMLSTPIPAYMRRRMTEQHIVRDVLYGWISSEFPYQPLQDDLIGGMIYQGKIVYFLEKLLPDYRRERWFGYTREQGEWCEENEGEIWKFLVESEYVFSTQQMLLRKYLYDAPFSAGMPIESPGRAVIWNGYCIVKNYVKNTGASLEMLMKEQDYHKILRQSKYRP